MNGFRLVDDGPWLTIVSPRRAIRVSVEPWAFRAEPAAIDASVRFGLADIESLSHFLLWALGPRKHLDAAMAHLGSGCEHRPLPRPPGRVPLAPTLLQGHLVALRDRGLAARNPIVGAVQTCVLAIARALPRLAAERLLFREEMVVRDLLQYRAAAIALIWLETDLWAPFAQARLPTQVQPVTPSVAALVAAMAEWRGLFSPDGRPYRSLNRLLMNLPAAVPPELVPLLRRVELEGPVASPLVLTALLLHARARRAGFDPAVERAQQRVLQRTTDAEIGGALARLEGHLRRRLDPRRTRDLGFAMSFLRDYPEPYDGRLEGLMRRAIDWHACVEVAMADPPVGRAQRPSARRAALPPIALPSDPRIEFLDTVERIVAEGAHMHHCIAGYAASAVAGECFLFHVRLAGEEASVEVDRDGRVVQAEGPRNVRNGAAIWGAEQLTRWGTCLREAQRAKTNAIWAAGRPVLARPGPGNGRRRADDPRQLQLWPEDH